MSGGQCSEECMVHYVVTSALVIFWLTAVALWYLKVRKARGTKQNSSPAQEMIEVSEANQDGNIIYCEPVFKNHNKKSRATKSEETTYAEIKKASQPDDGLIYTEVKHNAKSKAKNLPQTTVPETTYAEVKLMSKKPEDSIKDLYASVDKQKTQT